MLIHLISALRCRTSAINVRAFSTRISDPTTFDCTFEAPRKDFSFPLEIDNAHVEDSKIIFDEASHTYTFDNKPLTRSVTSAISVYFSKFNPDDAVKSMMTGKNWPRAEYSDENGVPHTPEMILKSWELNGEQARNRGTWMHWNIERYLNKLAVSETIPEFKQFLKFDEEVMKPMEIEPYRTEWRIAAPDLGLGGSIDFVGKLPDGKFVIMDWKRSKNLSISKMKFSWGKFAKRPVSHLPDCDGSKYSLQLNLYRYILSKYYGIDVGQMILASFHPNIRSYFKTEIPPMEREVSAIVKDLQKLQDQ